MSGNGADSVLRMFMEHDEARDMVFGELSQDLTEELISTEPHETDKREGIYHQLRALRLVEAKLEALVNLPEELSHHVAH